MSHHLDKRTVEQFREDGVTVLRGAFAEWVDVLREGIDRNIREPAPDARYYESKDGGGQFFTDYCNWQRIPEYRDFIFNSPAAEIAAELMNSSTIQLFHEHVLVKEAQGGIATPWHQDLPYYCVDGPKTASLWIPLDDIPQERTLEFVAGSHKWGKYYRPQRFNGAPLNENDGLDEIPDINANRDAYTILGWELVPGDAVAFDYRTIHGAPANNSATEQRRAFSLRLLGDGATFARREGIVTSPPFPNLRLQNGDPLSPEEFPVLLGQQ